MACGFFTTFAVTATLLGQQGLKIESQVAANKAGLCREDAVVSHEAGKPNALFLLKNENGDEVYEAKIRVPTVLFYDYGHSANDGHAHERGGAVPEKQATFLLKVPRTQSTIEATTMELRTFDGSYSQSTRLKTLTALKQSQTLKVGLK